ncbi:MAG: hypothetical protein OEW08_10500 [Gammaproteobacteria bacterium]|nr:hypothetical protein [Gammaproteobacteria bacterium]
MKKSSLLVCATMWVASCAPPPVAIPLPDADSPGARIMKENCSQCHGAPQPSTHVSVEWPGVVDRMLDHRTRKGYPPLSANDRTTLLEYLHKHAREVTP